MFCLLVHLRAGERHRRPEGASRLQFGFLGRRQRRSGRRARRRRFVLPLDTQKQSPPPTIVNNDSEYKRNEIHPFQKNHFFFTSSDQLLRWATAKSISTPSLSLKSKSSLVHRQTNIPVSNIANLISFYLFSVAITKEIWYLDRTSCASRVFLS